MPHGYLILLYAFQIKIIYYISKLSIVKSWPHTMSKIISPTKVLHCTAECLLLLEIFLKDPHTHSHTHTLSVSVVGRETYDRDREKWKIIKIQITLISELLGLVQSTSHPFLLWFLPQQRFAHYEGFIFFQWNIFHIAKPNIRLIPLCSTINMKPTCKYEFHAMNIISLLYWNHYMKIINANMIDICLLLILVTNKCKKC